VEKVTLRSIGLRLLPLLMLAFLVRQVDRTDAGFAALQIHKDVLSGSMFVLDGGKSSSSATSGSKFPATWR
jgi:hypothetical protein